MNIFCENPYSSCVDVYAHGCMKMFQYGKLMLALSNKTLKNRRNSNSKNIALVSMNVQFRLLEEST